MGEDLVWWITFSLTLLCKDIFASCPIFAAPVINITVVEGKTAKLPCSVQSLGEYQVFWADKFSTILTLDEKRVIDDERMEIYRPYTSDWNLLIRDVKVEDSGCYTCRINTIQVVKTKPVELNVLVPPRILNKNEIWKKKEILTKVGETVNITCIVSGIPTPRVKWYRHPLKNTVEGIVNVTSEIKRQGSGERESCIYTVEKPDIGMEGEILVIHKISRYCDGIYQCVASNGVPPAAEMETAVIVE
ncbi:opioid-binding protein/cell adhesion molecule-like isoform X2 [Saccostrea cucullata]